MQTKSFFFGPPGLRGLITLLGGFLLGFFAARVGEGIQNLVPYLLFPLLIGILGAFTVRANAVRPYLATIITGLVAWLGVSIYLLVSSPSRTSQACNTSNCASTAVFSDLLPAYVFIGFFLVTIGAFITCAIVRYYRNRHTF